MRNYTKSQERVIIRFPESLANFLTKSTTSLPNTEPIIYIEQYTFHPKKSSSQPYKFLSRKNIFHYVCLCFFKNN